MSRVRFAVMFCLIVRLICSLIYILSCRSVHQLSYLVSCPTACLLVSHRLPHGLSCNSTYTLPYRASRLVSRLIACLVVLFSYIGFCRLLSCSSPFICCELAGSTCCVIMCPSWPLSGALSCRLAHLLPEPVFRLMSWHIFVRTCCPSVCLILYLFLSLFLFCVACNVSSIVVYCRSCVSCFVLSFWVAALSYFLSLLSSCRLPCLCYGGRPCLHISMFSYLCVSLVLLLVLSV